MLLKVLLVGVAALSCAACGKDMKEASAAFDLEQVRPFLQRLSQGLTQGLDSTSVDRLYTRIAALPPDSTMTMDLTVTFQDRPVPLRVVAFMDDVNSPDLALRAPSPLAEHIDSVMAAFLSQEEQ